MSTQDVLDSHQPLKLTSPGSASVWMSPIQVFDFFSVFLERQIINVQHVDLSFLPLEYFDQLFLCKESDEGQGYLNLLMMLFTEHFHQTLTGNHRLQLSETLYKRMSRQFLLYCKCELKRRDETLSLLREENLFNPNVKTVFVVNNLDGIADIQQDIQQQGILIREQSD